MVNTAKAPVQFGNDALIGEVLQSLARVLAATGVSSTSLESHIPDLLDEVRKSAQSGQVVNLGAMQRECMEVMCLWRREQRFIDVRGLPDALSVNIGHRSFSALCRQAGAESSPEDLLALLTQFGAVVFDDEGRVVPKTPTFLLGSQASSPVVATDGVLKQISGFLRVVEHNLLRVHEGDRPRFERACSVRVAVELLPIFERFLAERAQEFIDSIDEWLERQKSVVSKSGETAEVGAGAYFLDLTYIHEKEEQSVI